MCYHFPQWNTWFWWLFRDLAGHPLTWGQKIIHFLIAKTATNTLVFTNLIFVHNFGIHTLRKILIKFNIPALMHLTWPGGSSVDLGQKKLTSMIIILDNLYTGFYRLSLSLFVPELVGGVLKRPLPGVRGCKKAPVVRGLKSRLFEITLSWEPPPGCIIKGKIEL